jgi:hypothetical protein
MMPALLKTSMVGDRASVIFAAPEEFSEFIKRIIDNQSDQVSNTSCHVT